MRPRVRLPRDDDSVRSAAWKRSGVAEVTPERCTVLAEEAVPVAEIDAARLEQELKDLGEDLADAKSDEEKAAIAKRIAVRRAMQAAAA